MMGDDPLPLGLAEIEQEFGPLMRFQTPTKFGSRVLAAMRGELRRQRVAANWKFALAIAGGAFLWLHLSFFAATTTDFHFRGSVPSVSANRHVPASLFSLTGDRVVHQ